MSDAPTDSDAVDQGPPARRAPAFRLMRIREGKVLGGVAGGIARAADVEPWMARLAVLVACFTGVGLLAYGALWIALPQEAPWRGELAGRAQEPYDHYLRIGLGVAAVLGVLDVFGNAAGALSWSRTNWAYGPQRGGFDFGGVLGLVLIAFGAGVLIARRRDRGPRDTVPPTPSGTASAWDPAAPGGGEPFDEPGPERGPRAPVSLTLARIAGWLAVVWFVAAAALGAFLWAVGAVQPWAPAALGIAASIALNVLLFVLVRSRRPGLIVAAIALLALPVAIASQGETHGDFGVRDLRLNDENLARTYRLAAGQIVLDLRDLEVFEGTRRVDVELGAGQITVKLPANVTSVVTARTSLGGLAVLGQERGGTDEVVKTRTVGCPERGELILNLRTRVGHIEVEGPGAARAACRGPA